MRTLGNLCITLLLAAACTPECQAANYRTLSISGSSTLVPLLREASDSLRRHEPALEISFQSPGSLIGQRQLISGSIQIACSDIPMDKAYAKRFAETRFAITPIAVITHPVTTVKSLTNDQLRSVLNGSTLNWNQLGGADIPIMLVMRSDFSGIRHEVDSQLMRGENLRTEFVDAASNAEVIRLVAETPGALGFAAGISITAPDVTILAVNNALPTEENVLSERYGLRSTCRLLYRDAVDHDVQTIINLVTSDQFATRLRASGFIPLHESTHSSVATTLPSPKPRSRPKPWEILGLCLAGTGLFLMGMRFIAASLKKMANRKLRNLLGKWTRNPILGATWGMLCGAVSQSGTSSALLLAGFVASGMLPIRSAMFIVSWSDVGTTFLVFLAAVNLKLPILYFLAFATIAFSFDKRKKYDALLTACIGLGLLLFGFDMVKSTAKQLTELVWVQTVMSATAGSIGLLLVTGSLLRIATQSSSVVTLLSIPLVSSGILSFAQSMAMICGTCIGSAGAAVLLSGGLKGLPKQLLLFKAANDLITGCLLFALTLIHGSTGEPIIMLGLNQIATSVEGRIALFFLATKLLPTLTALILGKPLRSWVARISPVTVEEELSRPVYVHDQALENPESAIGLAQLESQRILARLPLYLDSVRAAPEPATQPTAAALAANAPPASMPPAGSAPCYTANTLSLDCLHFASRELAREIDATLNELFSMAVGYDHTERLIKALNQHHAIMDLAETLYQLVPHMHAGRQTPCLETICSSMGEGLHSMLQFATDTLDSTDAEDRSLLLLMASDKGSVMEVLRNNYLAGEECLPPESRPALLHLTNHFQRAVWHLHRWAAI